MNPFLLLVIELVFLFLLTRSINRSLYALFLKLTGKSESAIGILSLLYLPGTAVHELAHLIVAEVLRVPTGRISFSPKIDQEDNKLDVQTGSLEVAKVDPVRKYLVGWAPLFFGLGMLSLIVWTFQHFWPQTSTIYQQAGLVILAGCLLFSISNNMFSSSKDLEGFWMFALVIALLIAALYLTGVKIVLTGQALELTLKIATGLTKTLAIVLGVNTLLVLINRLIFKN